MFWKIKYIHRVEHFVLDLNLNKEDQIFVHELLNTTEINCLEYDTANQIK